MLLENKNAVIHGAGGSIGGAARWHRPGPKPAPVWAPASPGTSAGAGPGYTFIRCSSQSREVRISA